MADTMLKSRPLRGAALILGSLVGSLVVSCTAGENVVLDYDHFRASGAGSAVIFGTVPAGSTRLSVSNLLTGKAEWKAGHGVRIEHAGATSAVGPDDSGFIGGIGALVSYDTSDKKEGLASVVCQYLLAPLGPVMCMHVASDELDLEFDELHAWVRASKQVAPGALQLELGNAEESVLQMPLPGLSADTWVEVYLPLRARHGIKTSGSSNLFSLRCVSDCTAGLAVHLDDLWLVRDHITQVLKVDPHDDGEKILWLATDVPRGVTGAKVWHDDSLAVQKWLGEMKGTLHTAPAGVYYLSDLGLSGLGAPQPEIRPGTIMRCEDAATTIFKNSGRKRTGPSTLFSSSANNLKALPSDITIEHCGFDMNGLNSGDFSNAIVIAGDQDGALDPPYEFAPAKHITIRHNRFFDNRIDSNPAKETQDCDLGPDVCLTRQRHAILVKNVDGLSIHDNTLSGGGRIKAGYPLRNATINHNQIDFVNDNGITIVDAKRNCDKVPCKTEHVAITGNTIHNAVAAGIFFGVDGQGADSPGIQIHDVTISDNTITGYFRSGVDGVLPAGGASLVRIEGNKLSASRPRPLGPGLYPYGIGLLRGDAATETPVTSDISISDNTISVLGPYGSLEESGIFLSGRLDGVLAIHNTVECPLGCMGMAHGFRFLGAQSNLDISANMVTGAGVAMRVESSLADATFLGNQLHYSTNFYAGQLYFSGGAVGVKVYFNSILNGPGWGIYCEPGDDYMLDIAGNLIVNNGAGSIGNACD